MTRTNHIVVRNGRDALSSKLRNNSIVTRTVNACLRKFNGRFVRRCKVEQVKNEKRRDVGIRRCNILRRLSKISAPLIRKQNGGWIVKYWAGAWWRVSNVLWWRQHIKSYLPPACCAASLRVRAPVADREPAHDAAAPPPTSPALLVTSRRSCSNLANWNMHKNLYLKQTIMTLTSLMPVVEAMINAPCSSFFFYFFFIA